MRKDNIVEGIRTGIKDFCNRINGRCKINEEVKVAGKVKENKVFNTSCLVLVGILLILLSKIYTGGFDEKTQNTLGTKQESDKEQQLNKNSSQLLGDTLLEKYNEKLNGQLKNILAKIDGVGEIESMIYFESGEEHIPAINSSGSNSITDETDTSGGKRAINQNNTGETVVVLNQGSDTKPLITKTNQPKITGVCIVAGGAEDKITELRIVGAVVNLFGLSEEKVQVYPMKK